MVLAADEVPARLEQGALDVGIAFACVGLVVFGRIHRLDAQLGRQGGNRFGRHGMPDDQCAAESPEFGIKLAHRSVNELDPPVGAAPGGQQRVEDGAIEDESAVDAAALRQCGGERRVVVETQVAAEPDQAGVVGHRGR